MADATPVLLLPSNNAHLGFVLQFVAGGFDRSNGYGPQEYNVSVLQPQVIG